jgi:hypothetical protein
MSRYRGHAGRSATYLKLEKPHLLFLEARVAPPLRPLAPPLCPPAPRPTTRQQADPCPPRGSILQPPARPVGMGTRVPTIGGSPLRVALLLIQGRVRQRRRRRETLLLALPVLLIVLIKVFLLPDPPLLCEGRTVSPPLLCGATGGLRPRRRRV